MSYRLSNTVEAFGFLDTPTPSPLCGQSEKLYCVEGNLYYKTKKSNKAGGILLHYSDMAKQGLNNLLQNEFIPPSGGNVVVSSNEASDMKKEEL